MTDEELDDYVKKHQGIFTRPKKFAELEKEVGKILNISDFTFIIRVYTCWLFEFLCFTIHTAAGREMYIDLLSHISRHCPDIAQKYWDIFDNQENLKERYRVKFHV
jgi:hypothetical protein